MTVDKKTGDCGRKWIFIKGKDRTSLVGGDWKGVLGLTVFFIDRQGGGSGKCLIRNERIESKEFAKTKK